jgi:hypothetical protein
MWYRGDGASPSRRQDNCKMDKATAKIDLDLEAISAIRVRPSPRSGF